MSSTQLVRSAALILGVVVTPFVLVGVVLVASIFGIPFGVPILALAVPGLLTAIRAWRKPRELKSRSRLKYATFIISSTLTTVLLVCVLLASEDIDSAVDVAAVLSGVFWSALAWFSAVRAWKGRRVEDDLHGSPVAA